MAKESETSSRLNQLKIMQSNIQKFTSEIFGEIRTCQVNNQIMFVGKDVALALGYSNTRDALRKHVESEDKGTVAIRDTAYETRVTLINESGLYALILSSKLPQAKAFKHWVTAEVLPQIRRTGKLSLDIRLENKEAAKLFESEAYRVLSYRANVISWLKGMLLYVAHGYRWDKTIADFVRWSEQYNLWCKMLYFGDQLEKELREEVEIQRRSGPKNLLRFLPDEFNREQYMLMRQQQGRQGDGDSALRQWITRGHLVYDEVSGRYCKTEQFKQKHANL